MPTIFKKTEENIDKFKNNLLPEDNKVFTQDPQDPVEITNNPEIESTDKKIKTKKTSRFGFRKIISLILILASLSIIGGGAYFGFTTLSATGDVFGGGENTSFLDQLGQLGGALNPLKARTPIKGEEEGRTNVLMVGKDSVAGLTDTIIMVSYYHKEKKVVTMNIPRDFFIFDGFGSYKINATVAFAEGRKTAGISDIGGEQFLADFLSKEFGIPIHYWVSINFEGFKAVIEELGGIEVDVDKPFTDCNYPTDNYSGFIRPCPVFEKGVNKMDSRMALIYARSRMGNNGQGSDFERGRRQQEIIQAVITKVKTENLAVNASKINAYLDILGKNMKTSVRLEEMLSAYEVFKNINIDEIRNNFIRVTWSTGNGILCVGGSDDGAYIITYCGGGVAGRSANSAARNRAKAFVQDILVQAQSAELFETSIAILGNRSNNTLKNAGSLERLGFTNLYSNNNWSRIKAATSTSVEKTEMCFKTDKIKLLFNSLDKKPDFNYTVLDACPAEWVLPANQADSQIVVWVS